MSTELNLSKSKDEQLKDIFMFIASPNELSLPFDARLTFVRWIKLIKYLNEHPKIKSQIEQFFVSYGLTSHSFFSEILILFLHINSKNTNNPDLAHYVVVDTNDEKVSKFTMKMMNLFSKQNDVVLQNGLDFLNIKKSPLYKSGDIYYILDIVFMAEKLYDLFFNDFFFEFIRGKRILGNDSGEDAKQWGSIIGDFLESYTAEILSASFPHWSTPKPKFLSDLKIKINKSEVEVADIYIRHYNKILVGQIKGVRMPTVKFSQPLEKIFDFRGEDSLFKEFGLYQLFKSIKYIRDNSSAFDSGLDISTGNVKIYPVLVFHERFMQTPIIGELFSQKLQEKIKEEQWPPNFKIKPITLFHISDLENMEEALKGSRVSIWDLMENGFALTATYPFFHVLSKRAIHSSGEELSSIVSKYLGERLT